MAYEIINLRNGGKVQQAVRVFETATNRTVWTTRRVPFENKDAWIARAFEAAAVA